MQNKDQNIDEIFRNQLNGFEVTPSNEVWDRISTTMGHSKKKRRVLFIWSFSGAASLFFAFLLVWYLAKNNSNEDNLYAELNTISNQASNQLVINSSINQNISLNFARSEFDFSNKELIKSLIQKPESESHNSLRNESIALLASDQRVNLFNTPIAAELVSIDKEFLSEQDLQIIEANMLAYHTELEEDNNGWSVGIQASPLMHFDQQGSKELSMTGDLAGIPAQVATQYQANISGGIAVSYKAGKRIDFISGINYSEVAQNMNGIALSYAGHNWFNDRNSIEYADDYSEKNTISGETDNAVLNNLILNTQIGLANINLPQGTNVASANLNSALAPEIAQNYDFKQQARYVEIPMLMRYKLIDKKLGLNLLGGFNTNVLVDNSVKLENSSDVLARGTIEGLKPLTWSSSLGMGLNYEINEHINFNIEPTLKIQLNSLNSLSYVNARPYSFGVFTGVSYQF